MSALHNKIVSLAQKRIPPASIAQMVGTTRDKVYSEIRKARTAGVEIPYFRPIRAEAVQSSSSIDIPTGLFGLVAQYAEQNELTRREATVALLESSLLGIRRANA